MPSNVTGDFSATGGVAHVDSVLQVKLSSEGCEIVGVGVHVVAIPRLGGTTVPSPVMRDDSIALLAEEQHLSVPIVRSERPAVTEHYGLALSPVLVVNLCAVFCCDSRHTDLLKDWRSEEHTSELQSRPHLVCRLLLEKKKNRQSEYSILSS